MTLSLKEARERALEQLADIEAERSEMLDKEAGIQRRVEVVSLEDGRIMVSEFSVCDEEETVVRKFYSHELAKQLYRGLYDVLLMMIGKKSTR